MALMENVLMEPPCGDGAQYNVRQLLALCTLGLVAGGGRGEQGGFVGVWLQCSCPRSWCHGFYTCWGPGS